MPSTAPLPILLKAILGLLACSMSAYASQPREFPSGVREVTIPAQAGVRSDLLTRIAPIVEKSIAEGAYPGAVIVAYHHGKMIYKGVFGNRRIQPSIAPMRYDTIFDIASLTKVLVTTPAIMQLVERGKLDLDAPVVKYWPAFGANGKSEVTVRELLTHTSGLVPDISDPLHPSSHPSWHGEAYALSKIAGLRLMSQPGTTFVYSDVNFIVLGYLVEIISGMPLNKYAATHIFKPLNMSNTYYLPPAALQERIAPTEIIEKELRWGKVHDGTAYAMGGVAGDAGVFSNASDLGLYAQCLLNAGRVGHAADKKKSTYLLAPLTILKMTSPQTPANIVDARGFGWDLDSVYSNRGVLFPMRSFGHTGWTGTSMWVDPATQTYLIILTSRTHPTPAPLNQLVHDRRIIANIVAASLTDIKISGKTNTGKGELARAYGQPQEKRLLSYLPAQISRISSGFRAIK